MTRYVEGRACLIDDDVAIGYGLDADGAPAIIGDDARIRSGSVIYHDVEIGNRFTTGHDAVVRAETTIGDDVVVGTHAVIDGGADVGSNVSIQTAVYVPPETRIADEVFLGPRATLTNDCYPVRTDDPLDGPTIERGASVGANATLLPGVTVGENAFVAAGSVVTEDVPPDTLAVGVPASTQPLPESLAGGNALE
ncbi:MAG: DapH/DapD/GlmU-related protein [Haloarculaceae archaeon]